MAPARFLSVRRRFWLAVSAHPPTFKFFPPGPRAGPGAAGPGQVLDKWRRFIAPRFSPGFLPVPQGPNYIPGMEVQEKVSLWTCLSVPRVDRLRPLVPVFTRLHRTPAATTHTHPTTVNCVNRVNWPMRLFNHTLILIILPPSNNC